MFKNLKEKHPKLGNALETFIKALIGAILGFTSSLFLDSCKSFDFSAEKLDVQVKSQDLVEETFNQEIEILNSVE